MLQQTQVMTVIPYFHEFMERFPTVEALAIADLDQVLHLWSGLGYYARARNLHRTAISIVDDYHGKFPNSVDELGKLPGIGRSTAGAIAALSMNISAPILDGNVKRVLTRFYAIQGWTEQTDVKKQLWRIAENNTPQKDVSAYTQAIMDLGAMVCKRSNPSCGKCPLMHDCSAYNTCSICKFPGKKPKKKIPVKSIAMYIFLNEADEVYLEKRPPNGIWGSLYSFPEQSSNQKGTEEYSSNHFQQSKYKKPLKPLRHTFSHYHLDIKPQLIAVKKKTNKVAETENWLWYPLDHSVEVGLATPVKRLLTTLG